MGFQDTKLYDFMSQSFSIIFLILTTILIALVSFKFEKTNTHITGGSLEMLPTTYEDLKSLPYEEKTDVNGCHIGQRKLFLSEVLFYAKYPTDLIVYIGSAGGHHTPLILDMFPKMNFIFIDPNYHYPDYTYLYQNTSVISKDNHNMFLKKLKSRNANFINGEKHNILDLNNNAPDSFPKIDNMFENDRVLIIQDYFTFDLARKLKEILPEHFNYVSDIRTNLVNEFPQDIDYLWNDALQLGGSEILKPDVSMFKFHPPYFGSPVTEKEMADLGILKDIEEVNKMFDIDMIKNHSESKHLYPEGTVYLQAWAPKRSSESRLVVTKKNILKNYDHKEWDDKFMYFKMMRNRETFNRQFFDIGFERWILGDYVERYGSSIEKIQNKMKAYRTMSLEKCFIRR